MGPLAVIAGAGAVLGAAGSIYEGQAAYKAGQFNAGLLRLKASQIRKQASQDEQKTLINARKIVGDMKANYGASGVTMEGSPLDVMEESIKNANQDALNIRYAGEMNARSSEFDAKLAEYQGASARTASYFGAAKALAGGGAKAYDYAQLG